MQPRSMSQDDNAARFLHELRALRGVAGIGHEELAARAHYPIDLLRAAEAGPLLPDLPVLAAYVRGCGGTPAEWEDRWRLLMREGDAPPSLPTRNGGSSVAAKAGALAGSSPLPAEERDSARLMAALSRNAARPSSDSPAPRISDLQRAFEPANPNASPSQPASAEPGAQGAPTPGPNMWGTTASGSSAAQGPDAPGQNAPARDPWTAPTSASNPWLSSVDAADGESFRPPVTSHGKNGLAQGAVVALVVAAAALIVALILVTMRLGRHASIVSLKVRRARAHGRSRMPGGPG